MIIANRDSVCKETGKEIKTGDKVLYIPAIKTLHIPARVFCEQSKEYKDAVNDIDTGWKFEE